MEAFSTKPASLTALIHSPLKFSSSPYSKNAIVKSTLRIWKQFRRHFGLQTFSFLAPISANLVFHPSLIDRAFSLRSDSGIETFGDLYLDNTFAYFQQLSEKFSLPRHHFFRYLQIRSFVRNFSSHFPNLPETSPIDPFLTPAPFLKGMISYLYDLIQTLRPASSHNKD